MIDLTDDQRTALDKGEAVRLMDRELGKEIVVLRGDLYDTVKDFLKEEKEQRAIAEIAMANALGREQECL